MWFRVRRRHSPEYAAVFDVTCSRWFSLSAVLQAGQAGDVAELAIAEIAACLCDFGLGVHNEKAAICDEFLIGSRL